MQVSFQYINYGVSQLWWSLTIAILSSLIMNGTCDIQQGPKCSKYLWDRKGLLPKPLF